MEHNLAVLDQQLKALEAQYVRQADTAAAESTLRRAEAAQTAGERPGHPPSSLEQQQPGSPRKHLPLRELLLNTPVLLPPQLVQPAPSTSASPVSQLLFSVPPVDAQQQDAQRLHDASAAELALRPVGPPRSTWEAQRSEALLELEQQLHLLERKVRMGNTQEQPQPHLTSDGDKENASPAAAGPAQTPATAPGVSSGSAANAPATASMGVFNTLRPSTLDQASKFYPAPPAESQLKDHKRRPAPEPLQIAARVPAEVPPPWEVGGVLGPWEHRKGMALLALEQERNALARQLEAYTRLDQVHSVKMQEVHEKHAAALKDASGQAGSRLERLYESTASIYAARRMAQHLSRALAWWRFEVIRTRRLQWAERVWDMRVLESAFAGWMDAWVEARAIAKRRPEIQRALQAQVLHAWSSHAQAAARLKRLLQRGIARRKQRVLACVMSGWQVVVAHWQRKRRMVARAEAQHRRSLSQRGLTALASQVGWELEALRQLMALGRARRLRMVLTAWSNHTALMQRVARTAYRSRLRSSLRQWVCAVHAAAAAQQQAEAKALAVLHRQKVDTLHSWHATAALRAYRRRAEAQIVARVRAATQITVLACWHTEVRVSTLAASRTARTMRRVLQTWDEWGKQRRRLARLAGCMAARRLQELLKAVLREWRVIGAWRHARLLGADVTRLQASIATMQSDIVGAHAHAHAHVMRSRAAACELQLLREEATRVGALLAPHPHHIHHLAPGPCTASQFSASQPLTTTPPPASTTTTTTTAALPTYTNSGHTVQPSFPSSTHTDLPPQPLPPSPGIPLSATTAPTPPHSHPSPSLLHHPPLAHPSHASAPALASTTTLGQGGLIGVPLSWRGLPPDPDHPRSGTWGGVRARGRHAALWLPGLQPPPLVQHHMQEKAHACCAAAAAELNADDESIGLVEGLVQPWETSALVPGLCGMVLVFGGVAGEVWLADLQAVTITRTESLSTNISCEPVALDTHALPNGTLKAVRDCACCPCGPTSFLAIGGFDGVRESMDMLVFKVAQAPGTTSLAAVVEKLEPRSMRCPIGRSHHTASYHAPSRSIIVFGGYSSAAGGHLNELWVFSLDLLEWTQPDITGDWPTARRGHVAVATHNALIVHGGFNGAEHFGDVWRLDLDLWHWQQLQPQGQVPAPCRGHAATLLEGRHLLVHGGFDGTHHMGQLHVLDTHTLHWSKLRVGGGPDDKPTARAMHTLTAAGPFCLLLGGCGPLGPIAGLHLLESPAAVAGAVQQQRLVSLADRLSRAISECGRLHARLSVVEHQAAQGREQLEAVQARSAALVARHNAVCEDASVLRAALERERNATADAQAATREAQLAAAASDRRLQRARAGGHEVAAAAEALHSDLEDARTQIAALTSQVHALQADCNAAQACAHQVSAERSVLHTQLAAANNEVTLLRTMTASMAEAAQQQHRQALQQQQAEIELQKQRIVAQEGELDRLRQELQAARTREAHLQDTHGQPPSKLSTCDQPPHLHEGGPPTLTGPAAPTTQHTGAAPGMTRAPAAAGVVASVDGQGPHPVPASQKQQQQQQQGPQRLLMTAEGGAVQPPTVHASVQELAQAHARAMSSELQLVMMEKDYASLKGEVASLNCSLHKERGAAQAAEEKAKACVQQMRRMELQYQGLLEAQDAQLRKLRVKRWAEAGVKRAPQQLQPPVLLPPLGPTSLTRPHQQPSHPTTQPYQQPHHQLSPLTTQPLLQQTAPPQLSQPPTQPLLQHTGLPQLSQPPTQSLLQLTAPPQLSQPPTQPLLQQTESPQPSQPGFPLHLSSEPGQQNHHHHQTQQPNEPSQPQPPIERGGNLQQHPSHSLQPGPVEAAHGMQAHHTSLGGSLQGSHSSSEDEEEGLAPDQFDQWAVLEQQQEDAGGGSLGEQDQALLPEVNALLELRRNLLLM